MPNNKDKQIEIDKLLNKFKLLNIDIDLYLTKSGVVFQCGQRIENDDEHEVSIIYIERPTEVFDMYETDLSDCKYNTIRIKTLGSNLRNFKIRTQMLKNSGINLIVDFKQCEIEELTDTFTECNSIQSITIENLISEKLTRLKGTFSYCKYLREVHFGNISTQRIIYLKHMFRDCPRLSTVNYEIFKDSPIQSCNSNFLNCNSLSKETYQSIIDTSCNWKIGDID